MLPTVCLLGTSRTPNPFPLQKEKVSKLHLQGTYLKPRALHLWPSCWFQFLTQRRNSYRPLLSAQWNKSSLGSPGRRKRHCMTLSLMLGVAKSLGGLPVFLCTFLHFPGRPLKIRCTDLLCLQRQLIGWFHLLFHLLSSSPEDAHTWKRGGGWMSVHMT